MRVLDFLDDLVRGLPTDDAHQDLLALHLAEGRRQTRVLPQLAAIQLPLLVHGALRGEEEHAVPLAGACMLVYLGADLLDNVADGELPADWVEHGDALATLAATTLLAALPPLALAQLRAPESVRLALCKLIAQGLVGMSAGQREDLTASGSTDLAQARSAAERKSGSEMALFSEAAALLAGETSEQLCDWRLVGRSYGAAVQIASDVSELWFEPSASDIRNARRTVPIVHALSMLPAPRRRLLENMLGGEADPELLRALLSEAGSLPYTAVIVETYRRRALSCLERLLPRLEAEGELRALIADVTLLRRPGLEAAGERT